MRVIRGYLKGKKIDGYDIVGTRPTMDRVKESVFAILQDYTNSSTILDLFCGSGSLGIEAISMNASKCYFVDNNKEILSILNKNINNLNIKDRSIVLNLDYQKALLYFKNNNIKFDIILVDAPYKLKVMKEIIEIINKYNLLIDNGFLVLEYSYDNLEDNYNKLILYKSKKYGNKYVNIYKKVVD